MPRTPLKENSDPFRTAIYSLVRALSRHLANVLEDQDLIDWCAYDEGRSDVFPAALAAIGGIEA